MLPFQFIEGGTFRTNGDPQSFNVRLSDEPDVFVIRNNSFPDSGTPKESRWYKGMEEGAALTLNAAPDLSTNVLTQGGFTFIDRENLPNFAPLPTTAITCTGGWQCDMVDTGNINPGDWVRLYDTTGALQIGGYAFEVASVNVNVSITLYVNNTTLVLAADATAGQVIKFIPKGHYPSWSYIASISSVGSRATIEFTGHHPYTRGEIVTFRVPKQFGMKEINNKSARVIDSVNTAFSFYIDVDIDVSGFTPFAFPLSAEAAPGAGFSPALVLPAASGVVPGINAAFQYSPTVNSQPPRTNLEDAFDNRDRYYMNMGKGVIFDTDPNEYNWYAYKFDKRN